MQHEAQLEAEIQEAAIKASEVFKFENEES